MFIGTNLIKLNLSWYIKSIMEITIPVCLNNKNIDKYNASNGYYKDICYIISSESGTDIILKDRKTEFFDDNRNLCQESCLLSGYNYNINKAKCQCNIIEFKKIFRY